MALSGCGVGFVTEASSAIEHVHIEHAVNRIVVLLKIQGYRLDPRW